VPAPRGAIVAFACAHRGLSAQKAENTLSAFGAAVAAGFPALEMDLRLTADGEVVVLHDAGVERTTDGHGRVDSMTWRELGSLSTRDGPVPRLEDLFVALKAWDGLWNLEVKARAATEPTLDLVRRHGLGGRAAISSFEAKTLHLALQVDADIPRAYIPVGPIDDHDVAAALEARCAWMNVDHDFLEEAEALRLREAGLRLGAWTVNDPARARELAGWGVECIITDGPAFEGASDPAPKAWV
jgi:glycerophosphoryl diester phosphodiesterase